MSTNQTQDQDQDQDQAPDKLNDAELNQIESNNVKSDGAELNQNNEAIKKEGFNWAKLSFKLSIASLVFFYFFMIGVLEFHKNNPKWDGAFFFLPLKWIPADSYLFGSLPWFFCFIISPIITIINLICILICSIKIKFKYKNYKHKRYILHGFIISLLLLVFYLFIYF